MEERLSHQQFPDLGFEDPAPERIKVAVTTFAFHNADVINLLRQRGTAIRTEKWDKMRKIDEEINKVKNE